MEIHKPVITDEMKSFLQQGLENYAPALLALSEFRRQVRFRMQTVLNDFSTQFADIGLDVSDCKPCGPKLDDSDLSENSFWVGLRKNQSPDLSYCCYIESDLKEMKGEQLYVGVWIYPSKNKVDRDRLFEAFQKQYSPESKTTLYQTSDGTTCFESYCDPDLFYTFETTFRKLIGEWARLLSGVGGIQPFRSSSKRPAQASEE